MSSSTAWKRLWLILVLAAPAAVILCTSHARGQIPRPVPQPPRPTMPTVPKIQMPAQPQFPKPNPVTIPRPTPPPIQQPPPFPPIGNGPGFMPRPFAQMPGSDRWICQKCNANLGPASQPVPASCIRCGARMTNAGETAGGPPPAPVNNPPVVNVPQGNPPVNQPIAQAPAPRTGSSGIWIGVLVVVVGLGLLGGISFTVVRSMTSTTPAKKKKKKRYHGDY